MKNAFKRIVTNQAFLLLLACLLPVALLIGQQGFYWDDWCQLFLHTKYGDGAFWQYFSYDRPGSAWTDILFFPICGDSPLRWHLLTLGLKYCSVVLFLAILRTCFPSKPRLNFIAALLTAVCPLFSQQFISIAYSQHYTDLVLFLLSVLLLLRSVLSENNLRKVLLSLFSLLAMVGHLTVTEYFVPQELLKLPLLWIVFSRIAPAKRLTETIKHWAAHFALLLVYCVLRLNIIRFFPAYSADEPELLLSLKANPFSAIRMLIRNAAADTLYPFTGFISKLFDFDLLNITTGRSLLCLGIAFIFALAVCFGIRHSGMIDEEQHHTLRLVFLGFCGIILGIAPFWVINETYLLSDDMPHADRCFMAALPWFCLILSAVLCFLFNESSKPAVGTALVVFLFTNGLFTANREAVDLTAEQNHFYHQLAERIPGIEDGTAIVDSAIIFPEQGNFSTASALNVLYPNGIRANGDVPIWVFSYDTRKYSEHGGFHVQKRMWRMNQPPTDYIYIDHDNHFANCVWVFTPEDTDNPHVSELQKGWIENTNLSRINTDAVLTPNSTIFGSEEKNWCWYYQKASLLRQKEQWEDLAALAEEALAAGYSPTDSRANSPFEWWPFVEGLYRSGKTEEAQNLAAEAVSMDHAYQDFYSNRLEKLENQSKNVG